ncbi:hypothetical protein A0H81_06046 [Grifola frondosa]|uniref:Uncharacterized protein n=1 Tax=Grifola frondosa TaxID=5627 RepID=A0A1C7MFP3_GRIFR|nr:hypothetical protein A0H81_06046 [Grifola frondosa]
MPYDRSSTIYDWMAKFMKSDHPKEARRLISQYYVDEAGSDAEFDAKVEECIFASVLLTFATGKEGRKPRLDFFLMHLVTSSIFFPSLFGILKNGKHKADLLRGFVSNVVLLTILRGRPVMKPDLLMSYTDVPRPPVPSPVARMRRASAMRVRMRTTTRGREMIVSGCHSRLTPSKSDAGLVYAAEIYGDVAPGSAIGAFLRESVRAISRSRIRGRRRWTGAFLSEPRE